MPELPEVETVKRGLEILIVRKKVTQVTNDNEKSNWDKSSLVDFLQSDDAVVHELNSKGIDKPTLQDIKNTNAYRQTTQWLQSEENGKKYLQSIAANSKSAKERAVTLKIRS